jgi:hypothetical protein
LADMSYLTPAVDRKSSSEICTLSTGTCPSEWHGYWAVESARVGTDWVTLAWQHVGALSVVRALAQSSGALP